MENNKKNYENTAFIQKRRNEEKKNNTFVNVKP